MQQERFEHRDRLFRSHRTEIHGRTGRRSNPSLCPVRCRSIFYCFVVHETGNSNRYGRQMAETSASAHLRQIVFVRWLIVAAAVCYGLVSTVRLAWVCDDAFISFRYARNLAAGLGLVYNAGERVEGYTNFLWTLFATVSHLLAIDPVLAAQILGVLSFIGLLVILAGTSRLLDRGSGWTLTTIPVAALAVVVHRDHQIWATSGLETTWIALLVAVSFYLLLKLSTRRQAVALGVVLTLLALSRPDGLVFAASAVVCMALAGRKTRKQIVFMLLPPAAVYIPYWLARYAYYGYLFPNTYYAKSADVAWYSQGLDYLWLYCKSYYVLLLAPALVMVVAVRASISPGHRSPATGLARRTVLFGIIYCIPYVFFLVRAGGDFMFARLLIPVTPILFLIIEASVVDLMPSPRWREVVVVGLAILVVLRWDPWADRPDREMINGIACERNYYPEAFIEKYRNAGLEIEKMAGGLDVRIGYYGSFAILAYYSNVACAIESAAGLTDSHVAHLPLIHRMRPGHEKRAPVSYLRSRGVQFLFMHDYDWDSHPRNIDQAVLAGIPVRILKYDPELLALLSARGDARYIDIDDYLNAYITKIATQNYQKVRHDYRVLHNIFFEYHHDPARERVFRKFLGLSEMSAADSVSLQR